MCFSLREESDQFLLLFVEPHVENVCVCTWISLNYMTHSLFLTRYERVEKWTVYSSQLIDTFP